MRPLRIAHLFPDLLNLYGDGGNVRCLQKRCEWRDISAEVISVNYNDTIDFETVDLVFLGGGPDREQKLASEQLAAMKDDLQRYVDTDGVLLAICGGYQLLGKEWFLGQEVVEGLGILDIMTKRPSQGSKRIIGDIFLKSPIATRPVIGYENHAGHTFLGRDMQPFGAVVSSTGKGNNDTDKHDGVLYKNVIGTYLHGPLLGKNPQVADYLLQKSLDRRASGCDLQILKPLDDSIENAANDFMAKRFNMAFS